MITLLLTTVLHAGLLWGAHPETPGVIEMLKQDREYVILSEDRIAAGGPDLIERLAPCKLVASVNSYGVYTNPAAWQWYPQHGVLCAVADSCGGWLLLREAETKIATFEAKRDAALEQLTALEGAVDECTIAPPSCTYSVNCPRTGKVLVLPFDRVRGIFEAIRQRAKEMGSFGRSAINSHYRIEIVEAERDALREQNKRLVELVEDDILLLQKMRTLRARDRAFDLRQRLAAIKEGGA